MLVASSWCSYQAESTGPADSSAMVPSVPALGGIAACSMVCSSSGTPSTGTTPAGGSISGSTLRTRRRLVMA